MTRATPIFGAGLLTIVALLSLGETVGAPAAQAPVSITLPTPNASFRPAPGIELVQRDCLTCHSSEYVTSQPALSKTAWAKEIAKMRAAYGATIPAADTEPILAYLLAQNPTPTK